MYARNMIPREIHITMTLNILLALSFAAVTLTASLAANVFPRFFFFFGAFVSRICCEMLSLFHLPDKKRTFQFIYLFIYLFVCLFIINLKGNTKAK